MAVSVHRYWLWLADFPILAWPNIKLAKPGAPEPFVICPGMADGINRTDCGVHRNFGLPLWSGPTSGNSDWHSLFGAAAGCSDIGLRSALAWQHTRIIE